MIHGAGMWAVPSEGDDAAAHLFGRMDQFLDRSDQIAVDLDVRGRVRYVNRRGAELIGYVQEELIGADWFSCALPPSRRSEQVDVFRTLLNQEDVSIARITGHVRCGDGELVLVQWQFCPVFTANRETDGVLAVGQLVFHTAVSHTSRDDEDDVLNRLQTLTEREYEVMELMIAGRRTKEIALELGVSVKTIETHRTRVMAKMQANSPVDLVWSIVMREDRAQSGRSLPMSYAQLHKRSGNSSVS